MKPEIWGPHAWIFLHSVTLEYPDNPSNEDKKQFKQFFDSLGDVLPCQKCKLNFLTHLKQYPLTDDKLKSKASLVKWLIDIHNCVNTSTNKKNKSYDDCLNDLFDMCKENEKSDKEDRSSIKYYMIITCIILLVVLIIGLTASMFM